MTTQRELFDDPAVAVIRCPECGYTPGDECNGFSVYGKTDPPETKEDALDFFEVGGADDGCVFCPACLCEFNTDTGEKQPEDWEDWNG